MSHRGDRRLTGAEKGEVFGLANRSAAPPLLWRILGTPELRSAIAGAVPAILDLWAGNRAFRRIIAQATARHLQRSLLARQFPPEPNLAALCSDREFVEDLMKAAAPVVPLITESLASALSAIEALPTDAQAALFSELIDSAKLGGSGRLFSEIARILNRIHAADPIFLARNLEPAIRRFIKETDFGELREAADALSKDLSALLSTSLDILFAYPGKVLLLISFLPDVLSAAALTANGFLSRINTLPPDLLCDLILSYADRIDPQTISGLINETAELVRKIQTGSALLGDAGSPRLGIVLSETLERILAGIDKEVLFKAAAAKKELASAWQEAKTTTIEKDPDLMARAAAGRAEAFFRKMQGLTRTLDTAETMDRAGQDAFAEAILAALDLKEAAEAANAAVRRLLLLWDAQPDLCRQIVAEGIMAIDESSLLDATERILDAAGPALAEKLAPVAPKIGKWLFRLMEQATDVASNSVSSAVTTQVDRL